jgi:flavin-dependent dehydrogenase
LRRNKVLAAAIEVEAPVTPEVLTQFADTPMFIFGEVRIGYLWIFPKSDHLSIGIGALHPKRSEL